MLPYSHTLARPRCVVHLLYFALGASHAAPLLGALWLCGGVRARRNWLRIEMEQNGRTRISTSVLNLVDQLNAKLTRLRGDIATQERLGRQLDTQLLGLKQQCGIAKDDLARADQSLDSQKGRHQQSLALTQQQARSADEFQYELSLRRKERQEVDVLIGKQREQLNAACAALAKYDQAIDDMAKKVGEQKKKRTELVAQNDALIAEISKTGKTVQVLQVKNQELVEGLDQLKRQLLQ